MPAIYLRLDGITGPSTAENFQGWMELESCGLNANVPVIRSLNTGASAGSVTFGPIEVVKKPDIASPHLFLSMCSGAHIASGTISVAQAAGQQPFLKLDLKQILIVSLASNYSTSGLSEQFGLSAGVIQYAVLGQDATDKALVPFVAGWDLLKNAKV
jgi:type VI protein secretion system component Hcp